MKPIHLKSSTYFDFLVENSNKDYNFPSVFFFYFVSPWRLNPKSIKMFFNIKV